MTKKGQEGNKRDMKHIIAGLFGIVVAHFFGAYGIIFLTIILAIMGSIYFFNNHIMFSLKNTRDAHRFIDKVDCSPDLKPLIRKVIETSCSNGKWATSTSCKKYFLCEVANSCINYASWKIGKAPRCTENDIYILGRDSFRTFDPVSNFFHRSWFHDILEKMIGDFDDEEIIQAVFEGDRKSFEALTQKLNLKNAA